MGNENTLPFIETKEDILKNAETLNDYLGKSDYAKGLIQRGKCFVAISTKDGYRFFPSRFMGYLNNSMEAHEKMGEIRIETGEITRDGRDTNPVISDILGELIENNDSKWEFYETKFMNFCKKLNIEPYDNERKYWEQIKQ